MFSSYSEIRRLRKRVVALEDKLEAERTRHLIREDALVNLVTTAHGHRGVSEPSVEPKQRPQPRVEERKLTAEQESAYAYYKKCALQAGLPEERADEWMEAELKGELPMFQMEGEQ
jgi:hypothetical protein